MVKYRNISLPLSLWLANTGLFPKGAIMKVKVVDYSAAWPVLYQQEAARIRAILADNFVAIYHIGSTAVEGLAAKPIIDIMTVVKKIHLVDACNPDFIALGYECLGEFGIPGRRYLRKGGDNCTHQVHIFAEDNQKDVQRHLALRDFLRSHSVIASIYGQLKRKLAQQYPTDIEGYCDGKDAFMKQLEQTALQWYQQKP